LRPIKGIADEVKNISAQNFFRRIHTRQVRDEWYDLSNTLNALLTITGKLWFAEAFYCPCLSGVIYAINIYIKSVRSCPST
jgi:hypothetical protein